MTIAWLGRFIVLSSLIFWAGMAAWLWPDQRGWAWVCVAAPALITPAILAIQCVWALLASRTDPAPAASGAQWLAAWLSEILAATRVFMWWQPFRHRAIADRLAATPGKRGMVLVHGFSCNRALWTDWMRLLSARNRVFVAVDLAPAFGSISDYARVIDRAVNQVEEATGLPPVIVGHSMGGLAIRAWAAQVGTAGLARVHHIFTLGTPHHGTALAAASYTQNGHEMRQGSAWLATNASRLPNSFAKQCTCYFSSCDNIVFPASTATLDGANNIHTLGFAHVQLVFCADIQKDCLSCLDT